MIRLTRISPVTGKANTRDLDITEAQFSAWANGEMIQVAMPNLSADDREFVMTGCTPEDWATMFPGE